MRSLAIIGAGGHGKVVAEIASLCGFHPIDFYDDVKPVGMIIGDWLVQGTISDLLMKQATYHGVIIAIGHNTIRSAIADKVIEEKLITLIHPNAIVSDFAEIGSGTVIMPGAIINASAHIGNGVIVNSMAVIEHDCYIGDYSHISPGAVLAGNVSVGHHCWIGANCAIRQDIKIGSSAIVGIGSAVVKDVDSGVTVVGIPAKVLVK
ncbi:acetyltransferase [Vibrio cholerae]